MQVKLKLIVGAAVLAMGGSAFAQDVVKIGHVGPTSGQIAHLGKDNENGARMAIEELNAKGVTIGGKKVKLELLAEDDAGDPKQGTAAAQKLVDSKVHGVVGHLNSGTSIPASKIYSDAGIPQISPSATNPKYTRQGYKTTFRVVADDVHLGGTLGRYAAKDLKGKSIAVIDDRTAYGQGVADEFVKGVEAAGGKAVGREFTNDKATDFTAILTSLKAKNPDIVFFGGMDAVAGPMMRQMKQLGINAKFIGGDGICTTELPKLAAGTMADGQVVCAEAGGVEVHRAGGPVLVPLGGAVHGADRRHDRDQAAIDRRDVPPSEGEDGERDNREGHRRPGLCRGLRGGGNGAGPAAGLSQKRPDRSAPAFGTFASRPSCFSMW